MDEQRKLRNLLSYTKTDSVEEMEDCNKLYEELLAYINKSPKEMNDEITITQNETEFVAKHKDYDVIGVGGNEFEAVLELSKALGALMFSKEAEHEALKKDVSRYFDNLKAIDDYKHTHPNETNKELEISLEKEVALYRELFAKLRKVNKQE